jgi:uncharacterized delta-60 repeat protein
MSRHTPQPNRRPAVRRPHLEALEDRAVSSAGTLDLTFGGTGMVTTAFAGTANALATVVQPGGQIVAVGTLVTSSGQNQFALARYTTDGSLDASFGSGGTVTAPLGAAAGVAVQGDGKILVAGTKSAGSGTGVVVARFTADGLLDASFGSGGVVTADPSAGNSARDLALAPGGKILVLAAQFIPAPGFSSGTLLRYNSDGSPDSSYGSGGRATMGSAPTRFAVAADGSAVVTFTSNTTTSFRNTSWGLTRFTAAGQFDAGFGVNGTTVVDLGVGSARAAGVAFQADGKIVTSGAGGAGNGTGVLARFESDGSPDASFGVNGKLVTDYVGDVVVQPDGRILVAAPPDAFRAPWVTSPVLAAFLPDGSVDARFGAVGAAVIPFAPARLTLTPDGNVLVAGGGGQFAVARYLAGPSEALTGTQGERFVQQLYLDLLQRPADPSGLTNWASALDQGSRSRQATIDLIMASPEYQTLVVAGLYHRLLGRDPDPAGLGGYVGFLRGGGAVEGVEAGILGSTEYAQRQPHFTGDPMEADFVRGLYRDVLYRGADTAGLSGWLTALAGGVTHPQVAAAVRSSPEGADSAVREVYHALLHRAPDPSGLGFYSQALQHGTSRSRVIATLLGSEEYLTRL